MQRTMRPFGEAGQSEVGIIPTPPPRYDAFGIIVAMLGASLTGLALWGFFGTFGGRR